MDIRLFFIGDSFVNGTGDPEALGWVGRVCAQIQAAGTQLTFYNLGVRGDTTTLIAQRWQQEVKCRLAPGSQAAFVFSFGANDVTLQNSGQRVETHQSLENVQQILATANQLGAVFVVGSPPIADDPKANQRLAELCQAIASICQGWDIPFVPTLDAPLGHSDWVEEAIANDGAHPGAAGYQALANLLGESPAWKNWIFDLFAPS